MCDAWETAHGLVVGTDDSGGHADADGFTNLQEFQAGTDPQDAAWAPGNAKLAHRWSFADDLVDSVGGSNAQILNDDTPNVGLTSAQNPTSLQLLGGAKGTSDYVVRDRASGVAYVYPGRKKGVSSPRVLGEGLGAFDLAG